MVGIYSKKVNEIKAQIKKCVFGQDEAISSVIKCLMCNGHALLEGVPGTAKTLTILVLYRTIKDAVYQRIQFTPDLLPSDIVGTLIYRKGKGFEVQKGPVFGNIIVADEINRAPSKVQSAMLQAMQEREVSIGRETHPLPKPFMVLATQNPLETKGVYPLPEAQIDRFLFKINVGYPDRESEKRVVEQNNEVMSMEEYDIKGVVSKKDILDIQKLVPQVKCSQEIKRYVVKLVFATRYPDKYGLEFGKYVKWGASPRASIFLTLAGKANAMMEGRDYVTPDDIRRISHNVLRHRMILNYEGKAEGIKKDDVVNEVIEKVPVV
ncbi:MAG: MoxR family ATPase [archaeon]|nr:MAG: MoxR family ATPase [archaeon]